MISEVKETYSHKGRRDKKAARDIIANPSDVVLLLFSEKKYFSPVFLEARQIFEPRASSTPVREEEAAEAAMQFNHIKGDLMTFEQAWETNRERYSVTDVRRLPPHAQSLHTAWTVCTHNHWCSAPWLHPTIDTLPTPDAFVANATPS